MKGEKNESIRAQLIKGLFGKYLINIDLRAQFNYLLYSVK